MERQQVRKQGKGRRKIEIKKIDSMRNRLVTFSKRRVGIFNKASELSILCGAEIAILVFSPAGKVFSYGTPSVTSVLDRYLNHQNFAPPPPSAADASGALQLMDADQSHEGAEIIDEMKREYVELMNQLEAEKKKSSELAKEQSGQPWWEGPIHDMGLVELQWLRMSMEELRNKAAERVAELKAASDVSAPSTLLTISPLGLMEPSGTASANQNRNYDASSIVPDGLGGFSLEPAGFF